MSKKIVLIGAFDTKGAEYKFLADLIGEHDCEVISINTGVMGGTDLFPVTVSAEDVARAGGAEIELLRKANDRGRAIEVMSEGASHVVKNLFIKDEFHGIIGMGGSAGTNVVTSAMRALPYGLPKVCISTIASGNVAPYVGISDIVMIPSLTDIAGINSISKMVLKNAAGALAGMLGAGIEVKEEKPGLAITMFGNTTPCVDRCREILDGKGFETLVFHATGAGGRTMEKLTKEGRFLGVLDITTTEWADTVCGGVFDAGPERLSAPGKAGILHLIAPGCIDMCNFGAPDTIPPRYKDRLFYKWNPNVTLMRTTPEENRKMGEIFAGKANEAAGKTAFIIPLRGFSMLDSVNKKGEPQLFWNPEAGNAFLEGLKSKLSRPGIEIVETDANINDPVFAEKAVALFLDMLGT